MKTLITLLASAILFASCSKQANELPTPAKPKEVTITYAVKCGACAVYFEDNQFNRSNPDGVKKEQYIVIHGSWTNTFKADTALANASLRIYVSVFAPDQEIHARIVTTDGRDVDKTFTLGANGNDAYFELRLK